MAMFKIRDLVVAKGDLLTAERWNALVELLARALEDPNVVSPLVTIDGAIALGQDFGIYEAKTTGTISARSGTTHGYGDAEFMTVNAAGVESVMGGFATFEAWNYFGASIASGIRVQVCWMYEKWYIIGGDCSGVS